MTMDQQSKAVFLGVLSLTTVAVFCAYVVSRRKATARAGSAKRKQPPPQLDAGAKEEVPVVAISPALEEKSPAVEDEMLSAAVAGVAAAAEAARVAGYDADAEKEKEKERLREEELAAAMQAPSQLFNRASANAKKYFREGRFSEAAEQYGIALTHCDNLENRKSQRTALHNNRGAAFEKAGKYAQALSECVLCLTREPDHPLARVRKSRVLEALGRPVDALAEVCAHLLLERDRFQAKIAMNPMMQPTPPPPPPNLEALLQKIANSRADEIMEEREKAEAGKTGGDGEGAQGNANAKRKPLMKQAVAELLRSFGSYTELERRCKIQDEADVTKELQEAGEADGRDGSSTFPGFSPTALRVSSLVDRGLIRLVKGNYDGAREDIFEAAQLMSELQKDSAGGEVGVPADVEASLWEWQGTFLQLELDADAAMQAYQRCEARLKADGGREPKPDVLIKMAWVHIDKDATEQARAMFDRSIELYPHYGSNYAHRARLREGNQGDSAVVALLEKALQLNKTDVYAREQLCKLYEEAGALDKAIAAAQQGLDAVPNSEALLTLKAGLEFAQAVANQDMSAAPRIGELFDDAIKAAPASPMAYVNKAMFLLQMMNDVPGAVEIMQKGVNADPTNVSALVQLANLKVMMARTTDDGEVSVNLLEKAVTMCVMREELVETLSVLVATEGRIQGAVLLGRASLA